MNIIKKIESLKKLRKMMKTEDYAEKNRILREILDDCKKDSKQRKKLNEERIKRVEEYNETFCKTLKKEYEEDPLNQIIDR